MSVFISLCLQCALLTVSHLTASRKKFLCFDIIHLQTCCITLSQSKYSHSNIFVFEASFLARMVVDFKIDMRHKCRPTIIRAVWMSEWYSMFLYS